MLSCYIEGYWSRATELTAYFRNLSNKILKEILIEGENTHTRVAGRLDPLAGYDRLCPYLKEPLTENGRDTNILFYTLFEDL